MSVFACDDIRRHILSFIITERCMECHQPLQLPLEPIKGELYQNIRWRQTKCPKSKFKVCNWCYYYVWEYH